MVFAFLLLSAFELQVQDNFQKSVHWKLKCWLHHHSCIYNMDKQHQHKIFFIQLGKLQFFFATVGHLD